ncbi:Lsm7 [Symbiodinium sp. CCMP2592]|nr:Lsm7 [Symbiodinium sp. CCMP2592]
MVVAGFGNLDVPSPAKTPMHPELLMSTVGVACQSALSILDFLHPEFSLLPRSLACTGFEPPATSLAQAGAPLPLRRPSQADAPPVLCGLLRLDQSLVALSLGSSESSPSSKSLVWFNLPASILGGICLGAPLLTCDSWATGPSLPVRSLLHSGQFLELEKLKRWSIISLELSDFYRGDAPLPLRNLARAGSALPFAGSGRPDLFTSTPNFAEFGAFPTLRSSARSELASSIGGLHRSGPSLSVSDLLHLGSMLPPRSRARLGPAAAIWNFGALGSLPPSRGCMWTGSFTLALRTLRLGLQPSVLEPAATGSALLLRDSSRPEASLLVSASSQAEISLLLRSLACLDVIASMLQSFRFDFSMMVMDFLHLGAPALLQSLCKLEPVPFVSDTAGMGLPPPSKHFARMDLLLSPPSCARTGLSLAVPDAFEFGLALLLRSTAHPGLCLFLCRSSQPEPLPLVSDFSFFGPPLLLQSPGWSEPATLPCWVSRLGSSIPVLDSLHLASFLSLRSSLKAGHALSLDVKRVDLGVFVLGNKALGPAPSTRGLARLGLLLPACGMSCLESFLSVADFLQPGPAPSPRSAARTDFAPSASDVFLGSSPILQSFAYLDTPALPVRTASSGFSLSVSDSVTVGSPLLLRQSA